MKEFAGGGKNDRGWFFSYRLSNARIIIENSIARLKRRFGCLKRVMDIDINLLPQVIMSCSILHNYCECKKKSTPEHNIKSALQHDKNIQPPISNLSYKTSVSEKEAKEIRNTLTFYFE